jgi:hypothetical protein
MRTRVRSKHVFVNVPFDAEFEPLLVALIVGLTAYELVPRSVLEIPTEKDRLDRLRALISECGHSVHDLSRVSLDGDVPRFNMPFEVGLALGIHGTDSAHKWIVFEQTRHRLTRSLSDLGGYDPEIHEGTPEGVLRGIRGWLGKRKPLIQQEDLQGLYRELDAAVPRVKADCGGKLFSHTAFRELVVTGQNRATEHFARASVANRKPVPPAGDDQWFGLLYSLAGMNSLSVTEQEVREAVRTRHHGFGSRYFDLQRRIGAFHTDIGELYVADINNDGRMEYVVCDTNSTGLHNNWLAAIFTPYNAAMVRVELPKRVPFFKPQTPYYFARPFLTVTKDGTVIMNFSEGVGSKEKRASYVWIGKRIRLVERVPVGITHP